MGQIVAPNFSMKNDANIFKPSLTLKANKPLTFSRLGGKTLSSKVGGSTSSNLILKHIADR